MRPALFLSAAAVTIGCMYGWHGVPALAQIEAARGAVCNPRGLAFNAIATNRVIILGQSPARPYIVVVPGQRLDVLNTVRQCIPDAFITRSKLGYYIQAGGFPNRHAAESMVSTLHLLGLTNARVVRFR